MHPDALKQRLILARALVIELVKMFLDVLWLLPVGVVVSPDEVEPVLLVEFSHLPEQVAVGLSYILESLVLPKLISIPNFDVSEPVFVVSLQRIPKEDLIMSQVI